jgi:cell division protease FtsH
MRRPNRTSITAALRAVTRRLRLDRFDRSLYAMLAGAALLLALNLATPSRPAVDLPAGSTLPTYSQAWTLVDLIRHSDAGEVLSLSTEKGAIVETSGPATPNPGIPVSTGATGVNTYRITGPVLVALLTDGQRIPVSLAVAYPSAVDSLRLAGYASLFSAETLAARVDPTGFITDQTTPLSGSDPLRTTILPVVALGLLMAGALRFMMRRQRSGSGETTSRSGTGVIRRRKPIEANSGRGNGEIIEQLPRDEVRLADVAGCEDAKGELVETIDFLKAPERFTRMGAKIPRGVLFYGPPGTGKTLLARAVAAEADVDFWYASGSGFAEMYVGVGAARVRDLFAKARESAKENGGAVIFIDEIDALARKRGGVNSDSEREAALNELLVAMDGFATDERVVVIAATNRLDTLDPAVLRPGRFTRKIAIPLPDREGREAILRVHAKGKPLDPSIDLTAVARMTAGFSGADLADLLNESAILAARRESTVVLTEDIRGAMLKVALGVGRKRSMPTRERSIIAAHEAGHAICGRVMGDNVRVDHISLYQHGDALGVTLMPQMDDDSLPSEGRLHSTLVRLMGGRVAEELCFREVTGGASNDFEKATEIARAMVERWGLGFDPADEDGGATGRGTLSVIVGSEVSPELAVGRERAMRHILDRAYSDAQRILLTERERLDRIAAYLFEHERIDGDEFAAVFEGTLFPSPADIGAWRVAATKPRDWSEIDELAARLIPDADLAASSSTTTALVTARPAESLARRAFDGLLRRPVKELGRVIGLDD